MSQPTRPRYRTTNWSSYTASLRKGGSLLIWLDKDMAREAPRGVKPGRPAVFSDAAIQFCLSIKVLFKLPLRRTTGMVASLLKLAGLDWAVPDCTTLCRRQSERGPWRPSAPRKPLEPCRSRSPTVAPMGR
ncbi:DDE family transposase [Rhodobacter viridis]|uniref:DDE family transposase n=1 Tax=Rhodobacter viridis TaxID=1054202 RepID=A0A318TX69_9RHOB|nr:DDE family transposase [Rhodobacter viridis]